MPANASEPTTILHVFGRMVRGGAEMRTLELMRHLDSDRFRFEFCVLSGLPGELDAEIREMGGVVHYLGLGPLFLLRFFGLLRRRRFGVVHSHVHLFSGLILSLAAVSGVPVRLAHFRNTHDGREITLRRYAQNRLMKSLLNLSATKIVSVSEGAMVSTWGAFWNLDRRCEVIYNGIDFSRFEIDDTSTSVRLEFGLPHSCRMFIHVGRMAPAKNHEKVIGIFNEIFRRDKMARLLLVGRGGNPIEEWARQYCEKLELKDKVIFAGERPDVPRLLKAADLLIFPSLWEGLPGVVLESCAAGTPILASDLPGISEIKQIFPDIVTCLPLTSCDADWAAVAVDICSKKVTLEQKKEIFKTIVNSQFSIERSIEKLSTAWKSDIQ